MSDTNNNNIETPVVPEAQTAPVNPTMPVAPDAIGTTPAPAAAPVEIVELPQEQVAEPVQTIDPNDPNQMLVPPTMDPEPAIAIPVAAPVVTEQPFDPESQNATAESEVPVTQDASAEEQPKADKEIKIKDDKQLSTITAEDLIVSDTEENDAVKLEENMDTASEQDEIVFEKESKRLPVVVLAMFLGILIFAMVYYFIVMSPDKVFDTAIDNVIDAITGVIDSTRETEINETRIVINLPEGMVAGKNADAAYLDKLAIDGIIDADLDDLALAINIQSGINGISSSRADIANYDARIYFKDAAVYASSNKLDSNYPNGVAKMFKSNSLNIDLDRGDLIKEIIDRVKNEIEDEIKTDQLKRKITTKKVGDQTTIALLAHCDLNEEEIRTIYDNVLKRIRQDEEFMKKVLKAIKYGDDDKNNDEEDDLADLGYNIDTMEDLQDAVDELLSLDPNKEVKNIVVNLYMNLANTQLISIDITVDDYYFQVDNLNGFFIGKVMTKATGDTTFNNPTFGLDFKYNANEGVLDGTGFIENEKNSLYSTYSYTRKENEQGKKIGNRLDINFFNTKVETKEEENDPEKIIAKLGFQLNIYNDSEIKYSASDLTTGKEIGGITGEYKEKIKILGKNNLIEGEFEEVEKGLKESVTRFLHYYEFAFRRLYYNKWDDERYLEEMLVNKLENAYNKELKKVLPEGKDFDKYDFTNAQKEAAKKEVLNKISTGESESKNYCEGNGYDAMIVTNLSKTANTFEEFVFKRDNTVKDKIEFKDYVFDWICVSELTEEDKQFSKYDYAKYEKILTKGTEKDGFDKYRKELALNDKKASKK